MFTLTAPFLFRYASQNRLLPYLLNVSISRITRDDIVLRVR